MRVKRPKTNSIAKLPGHYLVRIPRAHLSPPKDLPCPIKRQPIKLTSKKIPTNITKPEKESCLRNQPFRNESEGTKRLIYTLLTYKEYQPGFRVLSLPGSAQGGTFCERLPRVL